MPLPTFDSSGDLPEGVYKAALEEVVARFGHGTSQRQLVTARLRRIYELVRATGKLQRFIIFGSYITANWSQMMLLSHRGRRRFSRPGLRS